MKQNTPDGREAYITPSIEVIKMENEGVIATSGEPYHKLCPSVYIGSNGVYPASSPKSYWNLPRVSFGQEAGSAAMKRVCLPSRILWRMNGNAIPPKLEPPPKQAITISGYSPAISICFSASRPITVWCRATWLNTEPNVYLQFGVV